MPLISLILLTLLCCDFFSPKAKADQETEPGNTTPAVSFDVSGTERGFASVRRGLPAHIHDLIIRSDSFNARETKDGERLVVVIPCQYDRRDWSLAIDGQEVRRDNSGQFRVFIALTGVKTSLKLLAVGPTGKVESEKLEVIYGDWAAYQRLKSASVKSDIHIATSLGISGVSYVETYSPDFSEFTLTLKGSYAYVFPPSPSGKWSVGANIFLTAMPITTSINGVDARFYGMNAKVGWGPPRMRKGWDLQIYAGLYYTTMYVTQNLFGFRDMMGPQIVPVLSKRSGLNVYSMYIKYSPVGQVFAIQSLGDREIATGLSWRRPWRRGVALTTSLDYANIAMTITGIQISSQSLSLSMGLDFGDE